MMIAVVPYEPAFCAAATAIWNDVIASGNAFPQKEIMTTREADAFFASQTFTGVAVDDETREAVGVYILHPNNIGRCGHLCNASFAVRRDQRGRHIGETLVTHCLQKGREAGFRVLQLNAVVASNSSALALYKKCGFVAMTPVPGGFLNKNNVYEDIIPHYHLL